MIALVCVFAGALVLALGVVELLALHYRRARAEVELWQRREFDRLVAQLPATRSTRPRLRVIRGGAA